MLSINGEGHKKYAKREACFACRITCLNVDSKAGFALSFKGYCPTPLPRSLPNYTVSSYDSFSSPGVTKRLVMKLNSLIRIALIRDIVWTSGNSFIFDASFWKDGNSGQQVIHISALMLGSFPVMNQ